MSAPTIKSLLQDNGNETAQNIGFLLLNEFSLLAFASAIEPLRSANRQSGRELYQWVIASPDGSPAVASNGIEVATDGDPSVLQECRLVFVCAGVNVRENTDRNILNLVRRLDRKGAVIGAICTGTYVMAAAGLLDDRRCHHIGTRTYGADYSAFSVKAADEIQNVAVCILAHIHAGTDKDHPTFLKD